MKYKTPKEYSAEIGLPVSALLDMCKKRKLPYIKNGRRYYIEADAAADALKSITVKPGIAGDADFYEVLRGMRK